MIGGELSNCVGKVEERPSVADLMRETDMRLEKMMSRAEHLRGFLGGGIREEAAMKQANSMWEQAELINARTEVIEVLLEEICLLLGA